MDIKLKTNHLKLIGILLISILLCFGLYYFVDVIWNGYFVDWFMNYYMNTYEGYSSEFGQNVVISEPLWPQLKELILFIFIIVVVTCLVVIYIVCNVYTKKKVSQSISDIS